jgi:hypothetical protein
VNALGKHLNKEKGQDDPLNRVILEILDNLSELEGSDNTEMEEIAIHASAIRNAFFDNRKEMSEVIPPVLLVTMDDRLEVPPRKPRRTSAEAKRKARSKREPEKVAA